MAGSILIPLKTVLDDKGIKDAQKQFSKLGSSLKGTLGAIGAGVGLAAISNALRDSAKAATEDVKSQALLATQLRNTMGASDAQIASVEQSISKMQLQASVADDVIRPAFASLVRATGDVGQATALTSLALDVAAGTGKDLGSVTQALGKYLNGSKKSLELMVPAIKGASDPMAVLSKTFAGSAEAAAKTDPFQRMTIIFGEMQEQIGMQLMPALDKLATWLASPAGQEEIKGIADAFGALAKAVGESIIWLKDNYKWIIEIGKTALTLFAVSKIFGGIQIAIGLASTAMAVFNGTMKLNPIMLAITAVGLLALAIKGLYDVASKIPTQRETAGVPESIAKAATAAGVKAYQTAMKNSNDIQGAIEAKRKATAAVVNAYRSQQASAARLSGQAEAYAQSQVVAFDPLGGLDLTGGKDKTTTTGQTKAQKAAEAAAKKAAAARQAVIDAAQKAYDELKKTFEDLKAAVDEFNKSFVETAKTFTATFKIAPELGAFAQDTISAFDAIRESAQNAFDNKLITQTALNSLNAYANKEQALLLDIAKQRDNLAKKISIAQSITAGVMGSLNLTSMLDSETKTVTKAVTTMVNGIGLTVTSTFDEVVSGGLEANFKKLVDKTKTFATNLTKLKALGLNGNLFKQIVDAGAEGGNATAEAIIAGGASSVTELNSLFTQLSDAGNEIAKTSTDVMYNIGEEMTNGFIEGLRSEDQKLADAATALAGIFTSTFKAQIDSAIAGTVSLAASETVASKMKLDLASRPDPSKSPQRYAAWLQNIGGIDPIRSPQSYATQQNALMGNTYNVTVNAGAIANKTELPAIIVEALNTASKQGLSTRILNAI